jgi:uncharacterized membrane protein
MMRSMLDPAIGALLAGLFALLFVTAAVQKLRALGHFAEVFAAYRLLPDALARLSVLVPLLEALVAIGLLVRTTRVAAACAGSALLVVYAAAIAINLRRGRRELSCGCGGPDERRPIAAWMVMRNLLLAAVLPVVMLPWLPRPLAAMDPLTVGGGIAVAVLIYASLDELLSRVTPQGARLQGAA